MNTVDFIIYIDDREYCKDKKIQNSFKSYDFFKNKHFTEYILWYNSILIKDKTLIVIKHQIIKADDFFVVYIPRRDLHINYSLYVDSGSLVSWYN